MRDMARALVDAGTLREGSARDGEHLAGPVVRGGGHARALPVAARVDGPHAAAAGFAAARQRGARDGRPRRGDHAVGRARDQGADPDVTSTGDAKAKARAVADVRELGLGRFLGAAISKAHAGTSTDKVFSKAAWELVTPLVLVRMRAALAVDPARVAVDVVLFLPDRHAVLHFVDDVAARRERLGAMP